MGFEKDVRAKSLAGDPARPSASSPPWSSSITSGFFSGLQRQRLGRLSANGEAGFSLADATAKLDAMKVLRPLRIARVETDLGVLAARLDPRGESLAQRLDGIHVEVQFRLPAARRQPRPRRAERSPSACDQGASGSTITNSRKPPFVSNAA